MELFETIDQTEHEQVVFCHNKDAGLKAIIAIQWDVHIDDHRLVPDQDLVKDPLSVHQNPEFRLVNTFVIYKDFRDPANSTKAGDGRFRIRSAYGL